jgi:hypothetical protein
MADVKTALRDLVAALTGIATYSPPTADYGIELGSEPTKTARQALGGRLEPIPAVRLRWYPPDIERAQLQAQNGDLTMVGQLCESMKIDGVLRGLLDARTSVVNFPKRFYGSPDVVLALLSKNNSDRDVYNEMVPATEARLMCADELVCGVAIGEMVPVVGRSFPVLVRRYVQNLYYLWSRNQWFYKSVVGLIPIQPGVIDENGAGWVLHIGGGRLSPWNSGLWNTLGRSYINKTQTIFARQSYEMKHAHPARVAHSPLGATELERSGMLNAIIRWALNAAFELPVGWDVKLIESNGRGIEVYEQSIAHYDREYATALCGSAVMLQGTAGFSNMDVFRVVAKDLIRTTASAWDHTVNTQILPSFVGRGWGVDALANATTVETDCDEPKDRLVEAQTMAQLGVAVKGLVEAVTLAQTAAGVDTGVAVEVRQLLARFGVPVVDGAKVPEVQTEEPAGVDATAGGAAGTSG